MAKTLKIPGKSPRKRHAISYRAGVVGKVAAANQLALKLPDPMKKFRLETEFQELASEWESQTRHMASPRKIAAHPIVHQIIGMGQPVIPLILQRMKSRPWFWFHALMELSGEKSNPVTPAMRGDMQKMTMAWIKWGEARGII